LSKGGREEREEVIISFAELHDNIHSTWPFLTPSYPSSSSFTTTASPSGFLQMRQVFKYFDQDGSGGISLSDIFNAFQLMGFSFTETQVTALYAQ